MARYQKFEPLKCAARSLNYITSMVDPAEGYLPYWLVLPNKKPAEAAHVPPAADKPQTGAVC